MIWDIVFWVLLIAQFAVSPIVFIVLFFVSAPYGKHSRGGWGISMDSRLAWVIMEIPALIVMPVIFMVTTGNGTVVSWVFLGLWMLHYSYRTLLFPLMMRGSKRNFPIALVSMALLFNILNAFINGYFLFVMEIHRDIGWLITLPFIIGTAVFLMGFSLHIWSDRIIKGLRRPKERKYHIPHRGPFRWISNPNYLGEIVEWSGWAILTLSLPGLAFAVFTAANLIPRAVSNHRWYRTHFPDYPADRRILFPFIF